jgi:fibro-slime domain-containing protein
MGKLSLCTAIVGALMCVAAVPANAITVEIQSFSVSSASNTDFHSSPCGSCSEFFTNMVTLSGGALISNGTDPNISEGNGTALNWWTPGSNGVSALATTFQSLPINQPMFVSMNSDQNGLFETAILTTQVVVGAGGATISYGGDDDTFLVVNGVLVSQEGGIHSFTMGAPDVVGPGTYDITLFYADRQITDAQVALDVVGTNVSGVPEASTWAMMILGFLGVGFMAYRRKSTGDALRLA